MNKLLYCLPVMMCLSGCGFLSTTEYASNDKSQYLKSKNGPDLVIAEPLTAQNISDFYRLPDQTNAAKISIRPPKAQVNPHVEVPT